MLDLENNVHIHHWVLGTPVSGVTIGTCQHCGAIKENRDRDPRTINFSHSKKVTPKDIFVPAELVSPSGKLQRILTLTLQGLTSTEIAKKMMTTPHGFVTERGRELNSMGVTMNSHLGLVEAAVYSIRNGYLEAKIPDDNTVLEDTEMVVLDKLTEKAPEQVAKEIGVAFIQFDSVMNPTYEKIGVNNPIAAAVLWKVRENV